MNQPLFELAQGSITHVTETRAGYATLDTDSYLRTWSPEGKALGKVKAGAGRMIRLQSLLVGPDGAVLTGTTKIAAYDPITAKRVKEWPGHGKHSEIGGLALTAGGTRLVSGAHVTLVSSANGVRVWDYADGGKPLEAIALPSPLRKPGCECRALVRAPSSDACFAVAYSRRSPEDTVGGADYLFRVDGGGATQIAELSPPGEAWGSHIFVLARLGVTDRFVVVSKATQYPEPGGTMRFAPSLEVRTHAGELVTTHALEPELPSVRAYRYEHMLPTPDGQRLAVVGDGITMHALPSLEIVQRIEVTASIDALAFAADGSLLVAQGPRLSRMTLAT